MDDTVKFFPSAMTIAGSDSGGGAGVQADLRTFSAHGVYGCSAIAALTAQNPFEVAGIHPVPPEFVVLQIRTVLKKHRIAAIKTGMLFSAEIIHAVSAELAGFPGPIIVDPVMISTSGVQLLKEDARAEMISSLLPLAAWITPNIPETEALTGMKIRSLDDMKAAAEKCAGLFHAGIVVKGGHASGGRAIDFVAFEGRVFTLESERLELPVCAAHGTGCTFSSALAALLAKGIAPCEAVKLAKQFVFHSLQGRIQTAESTWNMFPEGWSKK